MLIRPIWAASLTNCCKCPGGPSPLAQTGQQLVALAEFGQLRCRAFRGRMVRNEDTGIVIRCAPPSAKRRWDLEGKLQPRLF